MKYTASVHHPARLFIGRFREVDCGPAHNFGGNPNRNTMNTLLLIKEIYINGFRNLGHFLVKRYFKVFAWFSFAMFIVVLYAFLYRLYTGFPFD